MNTVILHILLVTAIAATACRASQPFVIESGPAHRAGVVVPFDPVSDRGFNLDQINALPRYSRAPELSLREGIDYLNEAVQKMTGAPLPAARNDTDPSQGIILTTLEFAPQDVREDPRVAQALARRDENDLAANEAYYIRSETDRLLIVANTPSGLLAGVAELLESVGYEVLGMGPNWVHVPDYRDRPLVFDLERSGRPSFYLRRLVATSGQAAGVGTVTDRRGATVALHHPNDE
ncbi:MAG: hypothetical protein ACOC9P_02905, partial [bacterium]